MRPKVSVIIPVYNVEHYLERCVQSIRDQTLQDIEIILIDDESPDNCPAMCDEYSRKDSRIKVVHKKNAGLGMACNSGIEVATGDYIAFCDSDDWVDLDCYETLYNTSIKYKADAVYSGIKRIDENGTVTPMSQADTLRVFKGSELTDFAFDMIATSPECPNERNRQMSAKIVLYSGEVVRHNNIRFHSERNYISEDLLFNLDFIGGSSTIVEIPRTFYYYFTNSSSLTNTVRIDRFEKYKFLRRYILNRYDYADQNGEFALRVNKMFIGYVRNAMEHIANACISESLKKQLLSEICIDPIWGLLIKEYPIAKLSFPKRMIFMLTYKNHPNLIGLGFKLIHTIRKLK